MSYILGLIILAVGIVLNTKTSLGVSPIISVAYSFSVIIGANFGDITLIWYSIFVVVEVILHLIRKRYDFILKDLAQILLSLVFTRFMNLFSDLIPAFDTDLAGTVWAGIPMRILFLIIAIILTGVGAAMSLNAHIIPNPGDGIVQAIAEFFGKSVGFVKNCVDITCVIITCISGLVILGHPVGVGIGTILAMLGVGRVVALYNRITHSGK